LVEITRCLSTNKETILRGIIVSSLGKKENCASIKRPKYS
jgi:hypothetical protein